MKVALITGSYPPEVCGVGDYTFALAASLEAAGVSVEIVHQSEWSPLRMSRLRQRLAEISADILHMQYPTRGYGWHLGPQVLALSMHLVVTVHEASQVHVLRRASLLPLTLRSPLVFMTTDYERQYLSRFAPWLRHRAIVVPIGSNLPVRSGVAKMPAQTITYFGLIRTDKGLESVLQLARIFKTRRNGLSVRILGVPASGSEAYYDRLRSESSDLPVEWLIGLPRERVERELARTCIAYLPFPDGASERRGSLIAMMMNSVAIVTTRGRQTPSAMEGAVVFEETVDAAAATLAGLVADNWEREALQRRAREYAERFDWRHIADQHIRAYTRLLQSARGEQR